MNEAGSLVGRLLLGIVSLADVVVAQAVPGDAQQACRELYARVDRDAGDVAVVLRALESDDEALARTAAAIVRHEWVGMPGPLLAGLEDDPRAAHRLLEELARAPRPAARQWAARQAAARPGRSYDHRLLALAARGEPLTQAEAGTLLASLSHESPGDGFYFAAALVPARVADRLVGRIHRALLQGEAEVGSLGPLLDRLSPRGVRSLLGLAVSLPFAHGRELLRYVHTVRPELVAERVAAALDGQIPLDPLWLYHAGNAIDRPARVERVLALMRDGEDEEVRELAFEALLEAGQVGEPVLAAMLAAGSERRVRRIIARAGDLVAGERMARWLLAGPAVAHDAARSLRTRRRLEPVVQRALLELLADVEVADARTPLHVVTALLHGGDLDALQRVWPLVWRSRSWSELLAWLGRRDEPFVYQHLLAVLADAPESAPEPPRDPEEQQKLDMVRLLLVGHGDRRERDALVAHASDRGTTFLRRCRHYVTDLTDEHVRSLFDAALASEDPDVAAALLEWVAAASPDRVTERLWRLWNAPPEVAAAAELREIAVRLLSAGSRREDLVQQLRAAIVEGPLPAHMDALPYEVLNSMAEPLARADVELCATIVLGMPLSDGAGERRLVARWPDGTFGFPLVQAAANRLRSCDELLAREVFSAVVDTVAADPRHRNISRQRLKVLWRALAIRPALQRTIGGITARLWQFADGDSLGEDGAAAFLLAVEAERGGEFARAERLYRQAARELLRLPFCRSEARWLLGDRDPVRGRDPFAALSAAPHRMRWLASGEDAAARLVREFAGHDRATLDTLNRDREKTGR